MKTSAAIVLVALLSQASAFAQDKGKFDIKSDIPFVGSNIKHSLVTLPVPPDKDYAQLTAEQKELVRASYNNMPAGDEPPYPLGGLKTLYKGVADAQQILKTRGALNMMAKVGADGKVTNVSVFTSPDPKMTQIVAAMLVIQQFKPALCQGQPCAMDFSLNMNLGLE